jgi:hypothetical protein
MFDRPQLMEHDDCYRLNCSEDQVVKLCGDLRQSGFTAKQLDGTFGYEDLNSAKRYEVGTIELPKSTDKLKLREFLRQWEP